MDEIEHMLNGENAALGECHAKLLVALKEYDTGRWEWAAIDCCLTGKDADLEPWGQQGIHLDSVTEDAVTFTVHGYKSVAGSDVSLNLPVEVDEDEDQCDGVREVYLDRADEIVYDAASGGAWDGANWDLSFSETVTIQWVWDGDEMFDTTASAVIDRATEVIKPWEDVMILMDKMLCVLAGWNLSDETRCKEGEPGPDSAYAIWKDAQP